VVVLPVLRGSRGVSSCFLITACIVLPAQTPRRPAVFVIAPENLELDRAWKGRGSEGGGLPSHAQAHALQPRAGDLGCTVQHKTAWPEARRLAGRDAAPIWPKGHSKAPTPQSHSPRHHANQVVFLPCGGLHQNATRIEVVTTSGMLLEVRADEDKGRWPANPWKSSARGCIRTLSRR